MDLKQKCLEHKNFPTYLKKNVLENGYLSFINLSWREDVEALCSNFRSEDKEMCHYFYFDHGDNLIFGAKNK